MTIGIAGAVGDGVADDTVALRAAFVPGGLVVCDPGATYRITSGMALGNGLAIIGNGATIKIDSANTPAFAPGNDNDISGLKFTGVGMTSPAGFGRACIENDPNFTGLIGQRVRIHDCHFDETISTCAIGGNSWVDGRIYNNTIKMGAPGEHGIYLSAGSRGTWVYSNWIEKTAPGSPYVGSRGIQIKASSDLMILDNVITGPGWDSYGITSSDYDSTRLHIAGNRIYGLPAGTAGIKVSGACNDTDVVIEGNRIDGGMSGISVAGGSNIIVRGNDVSNTSARGIECQLTGPGLLIVGNTTSNGTGGIRVVVGTPGTIIRGNVVNGGTGFGITVEAGDTTGCLVQGNEVLGYLTPYYLIGPLKP